MIKVFAREIADGIAENIISNSSIAYLSLALIDEKPLSTKPVHIAIASANPDQSDLFYLKSVLVSTGWNNNDDVFLPDVLWAARNTPEDKQFNYMHNEKDIIGHITGSYVSGLDNEPLVCLEPPEDFNIVTSAVLYTSWTDEELQTRSDTTITEIRDGKWFVSMECLFPSFDYCLKSEANKLEYITRSEATAYLSKHLRAYGGTGVYQGYKVGRVLRNLAFSGKGLVNKPANPKSLIISIEQDSQSDIDKEINLNVALDTKIRKENSALLPIEDLVESAAANIITKTGEINMSKELELELQGVKAKLVEAELTIASLTPFKTQAEGLEVNLKDLMAQVESTKAELAGTKASLFDASKARDEAVAKWQGFEKKQKDEKRKASLAEAGFDGEDLTDLSYLDTLSDEAFDKVVAAMKKSKMKDAKKDEETMCGDKEAEAQISIVVETEKTKASLNDIGDQTKGPTLRETASSWFSSNVLKTSQAK